MLVRWWAHRLVLQSVHRLVNPWVRPLELLSELLSERLLGHQVEVFWNRLCQSWFVGPKSFQDLRMGLIPG